MKTIIRGAFLRSVLLLAAEVVFTGATGYAHKIEWFYIKAITEKRQVDSIRDTEDDVVVFQAKGKYGVRNRSANEVIVKPKYDRISSFKNGYAEFWKGDKIGVLNDSGKEYLKAKYKEVVFPTSEILVKASPLFVVSEKGDRRYKLVSDRKSKGDEFSQICISPDLRYYGEIAEGVWTVIDPVTCKSDGSTLAATRRDMASRMLSDDYTIFNNDIYKNMTDANGCRTGARLQDMPERKEKDLNGVHFVFDGDNLIDLSSLNDFRSYRRLIDMAGSDAKNDDLLDGIYEMNPKPLRSTVALFLVKADNMYELRIPMGYDRRVYASVVDDLKNKRKSLMVLMDGRSKSMGLFDGEKIIMPPYFSKIRLGRHKEGNDEAIVCFAVDDTLSESSEYYDKIYLAFKEAVGDRAIFYVRTPSVSRLYGWSDDPVDVEVANELIIDNNIIWCLGDNGKTAYGRNGQLLLSGITEMTPFARDLCKIKSGDKEGIVKISKGGLTIVLPAGYDRIRQNNKLISGWAQDRPAPNVLVEKDGKRGLYAEDGSEILPCEYDNIEKLWQLKQDVKPLIFKVVSDDKTGLVDADGMVIMPCEYIEITSTYDDRDDSTLIYATDSQGSKGMFDADGNELIPPGVYDSFGWGGSVYKNGKMGFIDRETKRLIIPCKYDPRALGGGMTGINRGKDTRMALGYENENGTSTIDIWTLAGKKLTSKTFRSSAIYSMAAFLEQWLGVEVDW